MKEFIMFVATLALIEGAWAFYCLWVNKQVDKAESKANHRRIVL
jgi:hypothetical protein